MENSNPQTVVIGNIIKTPSRYFLKYSLMHGPFYIETFPTRPDSINLHIRKDVEPRFIEQFKASAGSCFLIVIFYLFTEGLMAIILLYVPFEFKQTKQCQF